MLITHNLKAAWRNILKYKVQNTISVLCLSVGVICFAATFVAVKDTHILPFAEKYFNDTLDDIIKTFDKSQSYEDNYNNCKYLFSL